MLPSTYKVCLLYKHAKFEAKNKSKVTGLIIKGIKRVEGEGRELIYFHMHPIHPAGGWVEAKMASQHLLEEQR